MIKASAWSKTSFFIAKVLKTNFFSHWNLVYAGITIPPRQERKRDLCGFVVRPYQLRTPAGTHTQTHTHLSLFVAFLASLPPCYNGGREKKGCMSLRVLRAEHIFTPCASVIKVKNQF